MLDRASIARAFLPAEGDILCYVHGIKYKLEDEKHTGLKTPRYYFGAEISLTVKVMQSLTERFPRIFKSEVWFHGQYKSGCTQASRISVYQIWSHPSLGGEHMVSREVNAG